MSAGHLSMNVWRLAWLRFEVSFLLVAASRQSNLRRLEKLLTLLAGALRLAAALF